MNTEAGMSHNVDYGLCDAWSSFRFSWKLLKKSDHFGVTILGYGNWPRNASVFQYIQGQHGTGASAFQFSYSWCGSGSLKGNLSCRIVGEQLMISSYGFWLHTVVNISSTGDYAHGHSLTWRMEHLVASDNFILSVRRSTGDAKHICIIAFSNVVMINHIKTQKERFGKSGHETFKHNLKRIQWIISLSPISFTSIQESSV